MKNIILLLFCSLILACNHSTPKKSTDIKIDKNETTTKQNLKKEETRTIYITGPDKPIENLNFFEISDCAGNPTDSGLIVKNEIKLDTLKVKVKHWINCAYENAFLTSCKFSNDTLNIRIDIPHEVTITDGEVSSQRSVADCNCLAGIEVSLNKVNQPPETILINSKPIKNGYWNPTR